VLLLIVRHAIAAEAGPGGRDEDRPLTAEGEDKFRAAARGLRAILDPPDVLLTSPWLRAFRTAEIVGEVFGVAPKKTAALAAGDFAALAAVVDRHRDKGLVAVVGHEPWLSALLARLLGTPHHERLAFKKGGAALVDVADGLAGGGTLLWALPPRLLRALGGG
jgi:phosphohistidine phosphatase